MVVVAALVVVVVVVASVATSGWLVVVVVLVVVQPDPNELTLTGQAISRCRRASEGSDQSHPGTVVPDRVL